mgnify:CR=1 FL=1
MKPKYREPMLQTSEPHASPNAGRSLPLLLVLFVGSGCAALIYEIVWYQLLQLAIGSKPTIPACKLLAVIRHLYHRSLIWITRAYCQ